MKLSSFILIVILSSIPFIFMSVVFISERNVSSDLSHGHRHDTEELLTPEHRSLAERDKDMLYGRDFVLQENMPKRGRLPIFTKTPCIT
jgi:hypothetical protein